MATEHDSDSQEESVAQHRTQFQQFWNQYKRNRLSLAGGILVGLIVMVGIAAPLLAPHNPTTQFDQKDDKFHPMPPNTEIVLTDNEGNVIKKSTAYLGTDHIGRDILSRIIFGVRTTMTVAVSVVLVAMVIGAAFGGIAGYYRDSWIDEVIMRFMDLIFPFPSLILAIALLGAVGIGQSTIAIGGFSYTLPNTFKIITVITIVYIPRFARVMRGAVVKEMEEDYIDALKSFGASDMTILFRDITINTIPPVVIQATLYMGSAVLISAGLSFLGLGLQPPKPGLGVMLSNARGYIYSGEWWFATFPGIMIMVIILGFNLLGDGLRDALDPRHEVRRQE